MGLLRRRLLLLVVVVTTCVPASQGLRCIQCESNQDCLVEECALGQDLCRTTVLREWEDAEELEVVTRGLCHKEKTNRTMSYRMGSVIVSLTETVSATNLCNRPRPGARGRPFPRGRYLECASCTSLDQSCERGREQSLQCRYPTEHCIEVVTLQSTERSVKDEPYTKGCGSLPGCPGTAGFHSNQTFHFLKCCNFTQCNGGPVLDLQSLPPNGFQCYSCEGNSTFGCSYEESSFIDCRGPMNQCLEATGLDVLGNRSYTVRGCATASWCQGSHVADSFQTHVNLSISCCNGSGCNRPTGGAPGPGPAHLILIASLLLTLRLWGIPLWT
nr:urinary plasminogen activator receptor [Rattus norvegicus]|eukprot:NP_059046.1 urokinase plasminogen activator surface receptor isoform 2 precursor [Rattus norvegicus]